MSLGLGLGIQSSGFGTVLATVWGTITGTLSNQTDLQAALTSLNTSKVPYSGATGTVDLGSQKILVGDGTASLPSVSFSSDIDTGMYRLGANTIGWATGGTFRASLNSAGFFVVGTISPVTALHSISTSVSGQARFGYNTTQYLNIGVSISGTTTLNMVGSTPGLSLTFNGTEQMAINNGVINLPSGQSGVGFNSGGGGFVGGNFLSGDEIGLYSYNGDETVASFDVNTYEFFYANRTLRSTGTTASLTTSLYIDTDTISAAGVDALLEITSTTKGVLFPRMTTTQKNAISSPRAGLVIYDTTLNKLCVRAASAWQTITST